MKTFTIPLISKDTLLNKIEKWNRKATKLGADAIAVVWGETRYTKDYTQHEIEVVDLEIDGELPHYNGWSFISKVDHTLGNPVFMTVPNKKVPDTYKLCGTECDHCNSNRARNTTYIIEKDGDYKKVGSTCIKDFFNRDIEPTLNALFSIFNEINEIANDGEGFSNSPAVYSVLSILELSIQSILSDGFVSKAAATDENTPTSIKIEVSFCTVSDDYRIVPNEKSKQLAIDALNWIKNDLVGDNEFVSNLKIFAENGFIPAKYIAFIAAGANSYYKSITEFKPNSEWVGEIKKREDFEVTIISKNGWNTTYGWTVLYKFKDNENRLLVWFASNPAKEYDSGEVLSIKGTVKAHDEYKGIKQTILTRVKVK